MARRGRKPTGTNLLEHLEGSERAKARLKAILETLSGERSIPEVCEELGIQESMFHRVTDASKLALCCLVALLKRGGFQLLDIQWVTPHLARFGAVEIPRAVYLRMLASAVAARADFRDPTLPRSTLDMLLDPGMSRA